MENHIKSKKEHTPPPLPELGSHSLRLLQTVIALGLISFFTDFSSEMIYPLLPAFLASVLGAGALSLGVIEGIAESTSALLKIFSGVRSDKARRRKPLILTGYSLSGVARPLIGLVTVWPFVLFMRFADRFGKGLRTTPRDALIADVTDPRLRGRAYGFHRAMDHAGAVVGPLVAAGLLALAGVTPRHVFLLAALPGAVVVVIILFRVKESPSLDRNGTTTNFIAGWQELGMDFKHLLLALLVFTLGNSADAFLLLHLTEAGIELGLVASL